MCPLATPSPTPTHAGVGQAPPHVVQVLDGGGAGIGAHVRSLAAGLVARGLRVTVCAPRGAELTYGFTEAGARLVPIPAGTGPEAATLRRVCADADLVHGHGLRAGLLAGLALRSRGARTRRGTGPRHVPLVVTWHRRTRAGDGDDDGTRDSERDGDHGSARGGHQDGSGGRAGARGSEPSRVPGTAGAGYASVRACGGVLERSAVRAATVVLGPTAELVDRARRRGARDARLAPVALPTPAGAQTPTGAGAAGTTGTAPAAPTGSAGAASTADACAADGPDERETLREKVRADLGAAGRPLVVSAGGLDDRHDHGMALTAARAWRHRDPTPLLVIAGEGPERAALQRRIDDEALPVRLLGDRDDVPALLAGADAALLTPRLDESAPLAREALRAGAPLVATAVGRLPELLGAGAVLVPYGDADALAAEVTALLADPERRSRLAAAGRAQAASRPTEADTVAHVLSVYDELG